MAELWETVMLGCPDCGRQRWHSPRGREAKHGWRCRYCGRVHSGVQMDEIAGDRWGGGSDE